MPYQHGEFQDLVIVELAAQPLICRRGEVLVVEQLICDVGGGGNGGAGGASRLIGNDGAPGVGGLLFG
jgi:hypothetical protein